MFQRQVLEDNVWYGFESLESFYYFLALLEKKGNMFPDIRYRPGIMAKREGCGVSIITDAVGRPDKIWSEDPYTNVWERVCKHDLSTFGSIGVSPTFAKFLERMKKKKIEDITIAELKVIVSSHVADDFAFILYPSYEEKKKDIEEILSGLNREIGNLKWEVKKLRSNGESNSKGLRILNDRLEKVEEKEKAKEKAKIKWLSVAKDVVVGVFFVLGVVYTLQLIFS